MSQETHWGTIEEKNHLGEVINTREGLIIGRGEHKRVVSPADVEALAASHCTYGELATYFGVKEGTFRDHFRETVEKARTGTKMRLRSKQIEVAMTGNVSMLIWLGKNLLGQRDQQENTENLQPLPWIDDDDSVNDQTDHNNP